MLNSLVISDKLQLPQINDFSSNMLEVLTSALGAPRDFLATDNQIHHVWSNLPELLNRIPHELRNEELVRLCVAVAAGLFDSAINYAWNAAILEELTPNLVYGID